MAARVNATKMPALAVMAASTAVGNASVGRVAAAAQAPAPAESRGAAAGPSSATAQCSNSWLRDLHQVRYASLDGLKPVFSPRHLILSLARLSASFAVRLAAPSCGGMLQYGVLPCCALMQLCSLRRIAYSDTDRRRLWYLLRRPSAPQSLCPPSPC